MRCSARTRPPSWAPRPASASHTALGAHGVLEGLEDLDLDLRLGLGRLVAGPGGDTLRLGERGADGLRSGCVSLRVGDAG